MTDDNKPQTVSSQSGAVPGAEPATDAQCVTPPSGAGDALSVEPLIVVEPPKRRRGRPRKDDVAKRTPEPPQLPSQIDDLGRKLICVRGVWLTDEQAKMLRRHMRKYRNGNGQDGPSRDVAEWWFAEAIGARGDNGTAADMARLKMLGEALGILGGGAHAATGKGEKIKRRLIRFKMVVGGKKAVQ